MGNPFRIKISKDQLAAYIELVEPINDDFSISVKEIEELLKEAKVIYGIDQNKLQELSINPKIIQFPLAVAEGTLPQPGEDASLTFELQKKQSEKKEKVNFRDVMEIPSVKSGQVIAKMIPATFGSKGMTVTGKTIPAKNGKPLAIRVGKNVMQHENQYIATADGQVSIANRMIAVNPVFEVNGDVSLKTGNINFIGNVVIRGNVPTGFEVIAGGDIKVNGLVEGAILKAKGNILITGGITGGNRALVAADGNIQANYLNQAEVIAGQNVIISTSILHSKVQSGGSIICKNGHVIGGLLISGEDIHVKELGNHLYTKQELTVGSNPLFEEKETTIKKNMEVISENLKKLTEIETKLIESAKLKGQLTTKERDFILKQRSTKTHLDSQLSQLKSELLELDEDREKRGNFSLYIYDKVYPNTIIHFGKYVKPIQIVHSYVRFFAQDGEILFEPIG